MMDKSRIISSVKDEDLIKKRRDQMIQGAIRLFKEKGFHRTTTREIAKESGFSIGTLYEYIRKKEDVLFLVCDYIYDGVRDHFETELQLENPSEENLKAVFKFYYELMDDMQEEILVLYQEIKGLNKETRKYVLQKEKDMVAMLEKLILSCYPDALNEEEVSIAANNIFVQGHMWGFRRWILQQKFTIEEYIDIQIKLNLHGLLHKK
ncbi:TetR family transcriptional regulator [Oceanobacillus indicireducens]|uniref:TetR family transcriptional regulator n=2 Tax=Bacillaceae TaxID=186817 RepID=A0A917XRN3_9BACI|nr:TetR family transcriptional regulator [Oceanobacillus indicireducens]